MRLNTARKDFTETLRRYVPGAVFALLVIQPLLDIISYWANEWEWTALTTAFRMLMFVAVMLYAFIVSDKKWVYFAAAGVLGVYWVLHAVGCFKAAGGYLSPVSDLANFLRLVHLPLFTIAFITFMKQSDKVPGYVSKAFLVNFLLIVHSAVLSYVTGTQVYTYVVMGRGVLGWAAVHNSQSAIIAFLIPLVLYYAYRNFSKWLFYFTAFLAFALLFFVGTKVDYYSISLIFVATAALMVLTGERRAVYCVILVGLSVLSLLCYKSTVAYAVKDNHTELMDYKQEDVEKILQMADADQQTIDEMELDSSRISWEIYDSMDPLARRNIRGLYSKYMYNMVDRFGFERVFEKYNFSIDVSNLLDMRQQKRFFAEMAWEDADFFTKCFGYEYTTLVWTVEKLDPVTLEPEEVTFIYDLENDFPAVFYYSGYVGFAVYIAFLLYFVLLVAVAVITRFKKMFTVENGALLMIFVMSMGIAQFSGNVLRRPNVSIYIAAVLAYIYYNTVIKENVKPSDIFHPKKIKQQ